MSNATIITIAMTTSAGLLVRAAASISVAAIRTAKICIVVIVYLTCWSMLLGVLSLDKNKEIKNNKQAFDRGGQKTTTII